MIMHLNHRVSEISRACAVVQGPNILSGASASESASWTHLLSGQVKRMPLLAAAAVAGTGPARRAGSSQGAGAVALGLAGGA